MTQHIEVEMIGALSKNKFNELKEFFDKHALFKKIKDRLSFMYFRENIPLDIVEIKDDPVDLRFRITNKQPEIVLKYGSFSGNHARREIVLSLTMETLEEYVEFLRLLGWHFGVAYATRSYVYTYKRIEFTLVEIKDYGFNFEAEIIVDKAHVEIARQTLSQETLKLGLVPFDDEGLNKQCNIINNKKDFQFDLNKISFQTLQERFKEFFK